MSGPMFMATEALVFMDYLLEKGYVTKQAVIDRLKEKGISEPLYSDAYFDLSERLDKIFRVYSKGAEKIVEPRIPDAETWMYYKSLMGGEPRKFFDKGDEDMGIKMEELLNNIKYWLVPTEAIWDQFARKDFKTLAYF